MIIVDLATTIITTSKNSSDKLSRNNFSEKELQQIAEAFGARYKSFSGFDHEDNI